MEPLTVSDATVLLIGDELLRGTKGDVNLRELAQTLHEAGIRLRQASILPDDVTVVAEHLKQASRDFEVVFTSGGIGPTHDDVTIAAVARAFEVESVVDERLHQALVNHYGEPLLEGQLRMARVPRGARLATIDDSSWPTIVMENVWILPGVPEVFRSKLAVIRKWLRGSVRFTSRAVVCSATEVVLLPFIDRVVAEFKTVAVGSYPESSASGAATRITFDGTDGVAVEAALQSFLDSLPGDSSIAVEQQ